MVTNRPDDGQSSITHGHINYWLGKFNVFYILFHFAHFTVQLACCTVTFGVLRCQRAALSACCVVRVLRCPRAALSACCVVDVLFCSNGIGALLVCYSVLFLCFVPCSSAWCTVLLLLLSFAVAVCELLLLVCSVVAVGLLCC